MSLSQRQTSSKPAACSDLQMYPTIKSDFVGLDQLIGLLLARPPAAAVVFTYMTSRAGTHFAAHMIERQLERVAHVVADDGNGPARRCLMNPILIRFVLGPPPDPLQAARPRSQLTKAFPHDDVLPGPFLALVCRSLIYRDPRLRRSTAVSAAVRTDAGKVPAILAYWPCRQQPLTGASADRQVQLAGAHCRRNLHGEIRPCPRRWKNL